MSDKPKELEIGDTFKVGIHKFEVIEGKRLDKSFDPIADFKKIE